MLNYNKKTNQLYLDYFCLLKTLGIRRCVQKLQRHSAQTQLRSAQQTTPFPFALAPHQRTRRERGGRCLLSSRRRVVHNRGGGGMWEISPNIIIRCEEVCKKRRNLSYHWLSQVCVCVTCVYKSVCVCVSIRPLRDR